MHLYDIRRSKVKTIIKDRCDGVAARFAERMGKPANYISRVLNASGAESKKNIGEDFAREIEIEFKYPRYWLDKVEDDGGGMDKLTFHGLLLTPEAARLGQEWEKLEEPMRGQIQVMIESLVASQIRAARSASKTKKSDEKRPPPV